MHRIAAKCVLIDPGVKPSMAQERRRVFDTGNSDKML